MRILILGGSGMLGHEAYRIFQSDSDVYALMRNDFSAVKGFGIFDKNKTVCGVDAGDYPLLEKMLKKISPDAVINCIGIVKQVKETHDPIKSIEINSLFPHKLSGICAQNNCRLIHLSTDCVFSGIKGDYTEKDNPDPVDLYGWTKLLGEVTSGNVLTIRTSMIGRELNTDHGLLEWFLNQEGKEVKGYTNAIFSGFTTRALSIILKEIIFKHSALKGLYHVSSEPISKFNLLMLIKIKMNLNIEIIPDDRLRCDRTLNSSKFRKETNYTPPSWENMIEVLAENIKKGER